MLDLHHLLRRDRDSNPGNSYPFTAFRVRPDRPLRHLSKNFVSPTINTWLAERQGFEPRVPRGTTVFKTAAIDHSATSPVFVVEVLLFFKSDAKVRIIFEYANVWIKKV